MHLPMKRFLLFAYVLLGSGCDLYFGHHGDDCKATGLIALPPGARNPVTGVCERSGGGTDPCGNPIPTAGASDFAGAPIAMPDWATCPGICEGYDEATCRGADGCRAVYTSSEACDDAGHCTWVDTFAACWGTAPSGPVRGGVCEGLDAQECSRHDDCSAVHAWSPAPDGTIGSFDHCKAEAPCTPPPGGPELRNPDTGKCENFGGGGCGGVPIAMPDWGFCTSVCTGLDEASCKATDACRAIYANACSPWQDCFALTYKECWQTAPSGPVRGGGCAGLTAGECSRHDDCIANHDSDWSACSPMDSTCAWTIGGFLSCGDESTPPPPPPPPPSCESITDEMTCIGRSDCEPEYVGSNCSCDMFGCTCTTWTFTSCRTAG